MVIVVACLAWVSVQVYRYFRPRAGGKACGGSCCDSAAKQPEMGNGGRSAGQVMMISSDDLRARVKARKG